MELKQWIRDAKIFAEEVLDEECLKALEKSPNRNLIYREIAEAGKRTKETMLRRAEEMKLDGMDLVIAQETATDYSQEAMRGTLGRWMEKIMPGFSEMYR